MPETRWSANKTALKMCLLELGSCACYYMRALQPWLPPEFVCCSQSCLSQEELLAEIVTAFLGDQGNMSWHLPIPKPSVLVPCFVSQTVMAILPEELSTWNEHRMLPVSPHDLIITVLTVPATNLGFVSGLSFQVLPLPWKAAHSPFSLLSYCLLHSQTHYLRYSLPNVT